MQKDDKELYFAQNMPVPETPLPARGVKPWQLTKVVGKPLPRVDAYERVSGNAVYPSDVLLSDMLYAAILRCPHPHAVVKDVDTKEAEKMIGVRAVLTDASKEADVLWPWSPDVKTRLFDPECRFEGEVVAAVAAETLYQAWDAVRAIKVKYEVLPFVSDERRSLDAGAAQVHTTGNKIKTDKYERGDVAKGFAEADVVLEQTYRNECELHTPQELHGGVAKWDGDSLTIWESTQGVFAVQARVAEVLRLPLSKVRVIGHYMGGGFGSKLQADKATIIAALLARKTARPVKMVLSREETFLAVGNRPPGTHETESRSEEGRYADRPRVQRHRRAAAPIPQAARRSWTGWCAIFTSARTCAPRPRTCTSTPDLRGLSARRAIRRARGRLSRCSIAWPRRSRWILSSSGSRISLPSARRGRAILPIPRPVFGSALKKAQRPSDGRKRGKEPL